MNTPLARSAGAAALCLLASGAAVPDAPAGVWRVDPEGGGDAPTIQAAVDSSADRDTVLLAPGTYREHLSVRLKGITLRAEGEPGSAILDGGGSGRILTVEQTGSTVFLEGLVLQNGFRNVPEGPGGAVAVFASPLIVQDCTFRNNFALGVGGGIFSTRQVLSGRPGNGALQQPVPLLAVRTLFENNFAGSDGGAVHADEQSTQFVDCTFRQNDAVQGAGVSLLGESHLLLRCRFLDNDAAVGGGGLYASGNALVEVRETLLDSNHAEDFGGAIRCVNATGLALRKCTLLHNSSANGAGVDASRTTVDAEQVMWYGNTASTQGGGLRIDEGIGNRFYRCTWLQNTAPRSASVGLRSGSMRVERSVVGDSDPKAIECLASSTVEDSCNIGGPMTGDCIGFESRMVLEACPSSPDRLCTLPGTSCGIAGHADETCPPGACSTPAVPVTWGKLKTLYR